jgi:hypothetical protein
MREGSAAGRLWAWSDVRRRWRSLIVLGLLAGVTAGLALAATEGAQRSATALDRLRDHEGRPDAVLFPSQVGNFEPDWEAVEALPEVEAVLPWALVFGAIDDPELAAEDTGPGIFAAVDDRFMGEGNEPVVREGRMFDPDAVDELVITPGVQDVVDLEVGDQVPMTFFTFEQDEGAPPEGPSVDFEVVGVVTTSNDQLFVGDGMVVASPGLMAEHGDGIAAIQNADVVLDQDPGAIERIREDVDEVLGAGTPVLDLDESARRTNTTTNVERGALLAFAAVLIGIGMLLVGQAVVRSAQVLADDAPTLRSLGMPRRAMVLAVLRSHTTTFTVATAAAVVTATLASIWLPVGTAAELDPSRGIVLDPVLTVLFVAGLLVVLVATVVFAGWRATDPDLARRRRSSKDPLASVRRNAPIPVALGTSMAFPRRGDRRHGTVGPALVGAAVGILGVVGVLTIDRGLEDALDHPERAGVAYDAYALPPPDLYTPEGIDQAYVDDVRAVDEVADAAIIDRLVYDLDGVGVPTFAARPDVGQLSPDFTLVTTEGRAPSTPDEVALGPATMRALDVEIGDTVTFDRGGNELLVVGAALFPHDVHSGFDEGALLTAAGWDARIPPPEEDDSDTSRLLAVRFDDGVDQEAGITALDEAVGEQSAEIAPPDVPPELANLAGVGDLPFLLGLFLAVLAVGAVAHALATSVQRRRGDYAILRTLGMTRRGTRAVLHSQGTTIALVGLVVGIPLGLVIGRTAWSEVASSVPLAVVRPLAVVLTLLVIPLGILLVNLLAWWPGRRLGHLHPAEELRSEQ